MNNEIEIKEFSELNNIEIEVTKHICRQSKLKCNCGVYRKLKKSSQSKVGYQLSLYCGNRECHPRFGIERPEHSLKMKEKLLDKDSKFSKSLFQKGELRNSKVNSIHFKKTILKKNNISFTSDDEIPYIYSKYLSDTRKSTSYRGKQILIRYNKWESFYKELIIKLLGVIPTEQWISTLSDDEVQIAWSKVHSINSIRNVKNSEKMGRNSFFKQETLTDLKYNSQNLSQITFRSGWEYDLAVIFEKEKIEWSFEELNIISIDGKSFYIPDFIINLNGKKTIIEVKGGFFNQDKEYYLANKIRAGVNYAEEHNYNFYMLYKKPDSNFKNNLIDMRK